MIAPIASPAPDRELANLLRVLDVSLDCYDHWHESYQIKDVQREVPALLSIVRGKYGRDGRDPEGNPARNLNKWHRQNAEMALISCIEHSSSYLLEELQNSDDPAVIADVLMIFIQAAELSPELVSNREQVAIEIERLGEKWQDMEDNRWGLVPKLAAQAFRWLKHGPLPPNDYI